MKKIIIAVAFMLGVSAVNAQTFNEGTSVIQLGAGIGSDFGLPLGVSYEYGISDKIGLGAYAGYASKSYALGFGSDYKVTYMIFGAKGNYHFYQSDNLDAYGGVLLGYNSAKVTYDNQNGLFTAPSYGGAVFGGTVGARYYFTDNIAAFGEVGYGIGYLTVGLAYKL
ncbi:MAG: outer membrane beta-barrel protein [Flavobacterium sp.]|nr:outer membrane beta-barrel protein [Flavobacterium sp.]